MGYTWSRTIPVYYVAMGLLVSSAFAYYIGIRNSSNFHAPAQAPSISSPAESTACDYSLSRLEGFNYVKPLLYAEQNCEAEKYHSLKTDIIKLTEALKTEGKLSTCSVYFRDLNDETWMSINGDEKFDPGSLLKIPLLITALRISEGDPSFLDKRVLYDKVFNLARSPHFTSKTIQTGNYYSIRELLRCMISYSDNAAASLLLKNIDEKEIVKTHTDLGLARPKKTEAFQVSAKEFSVFLKVLYDAGYLTIKDSEYATGLLAACDFNSGIAAGLPANIRIAHKFGEGGNLDTRELQLHETAIVYLDNRPYLLTVMVKGSDYDELAKVLSIISKTTFDNLTLHS